MTTPLARDAIGSGSFRLGQVGIRGRVCAPPRPISRPLTAVPGATTSLQPGVVEVCVRSLVARTRRLEPAINLGIGTLGLSSAGDTMADTSLILACEDFINAYQRLVHSARDGDEDAYDAATVEAERLVEDIAARAPTTLEGIRAKARAAVLLWAGTDADFSYGDETAALARSLLVDLAEMPESSTVINLDAARRSSVECAARYDHTGASMEEAGHYAMHQHRHSGASCRRIELITGSVKRRHWTAAEKAAKVEESMRPGINVSALARQRGVSPS
jgi:hypothetical protein